MYGKEENISAAEKLREQLRRDMLTDLDLGVGQSGGEGEEEEEGVVRFGVEDSRVERLRREREREGEGGGTRTQERGGLQSRELGRDGSRYKTGTFHGREYS